MYSTLTEIFEEDGHFDNDYVFAPYYWSTGDGLLSDLAFRGG